MKKLDKLILAIDSDNFNDIQNLINELCPPIKIVKIGPISFLNNYQKIIEFINEKNISIMFDFKFFDIPNTMSSSINFMFSNNIKIFTIHALSGEKAIKEVKKNLVSKEQELEQKSPKMFAVTVLTSFDENDLYSLNFKGDIYFENVTLIKGKKLILNNVTFLIPSGKLVALVGKSGAGKSSILKLITGILTPTKGKIFIDNIDISLIDPQVLRSNISVIMQENQLFDETIYENVKIGKLNAKKSEILNACKLAHVSEFTDKFPEKLFTKVGPRGSNLSGGQRQRVNIARALLRDCPIFLLDEPTTALDHKSEDLLHKAFKQVIQNKTTLYISHRISSIKNADKIIVIKEGKIIEEGTHNNLIQNKSLYNDLYNLHKIEGKSE